MATRRANREGSWGFDTKRNLYWAMLSTPSGQRITKYSKDEEIVKDWLNEQRLLIGRDQHVEPKKMTLDIWLQIWLKDYHKPAVKQRSYERTKSLVEHITRELGEKQVQKLKPENLQKLYNQMLEAGFSGNTVHKVHVTAYSALQRAMINRYVMQNVAAMVDPPKFEKKEIEIYTPAEVGLLMSVAADHRYYLIFLLAFTTGMRLGELLGLRWEDVLKNEIYVRQNLQRTAEEGFILGSPKTVAGKRKIPIPPNAITALEKHRKEWATNRLAHPMDEKDPFKDLIFLSQNNTPIAPEKFLTKYWRNLQIMAEFKMNEVIPKPMSEHKSLAKILEACREKKNPKKEWKRFPIKNFHSIRHTFATTLLANLPPGKSIVDVSKILGHAKVSTTLDIYGHCIPENKQALADIVSGIFGI